MKVDRDIRCLLPNACRITDKASAWLHSEVGNGRLAAWVLARNGHGECCRCVGRQRSGVFSYHFYSSGGHAWQSLWSVLSAAYPSHIPSSSQFMRKGTDRLCKRITVWDRVEHHWSSDMRKRTGQCTGLMIEAWTLSTGAILCFSPPLISHSHGRPPTVGFLPEFLDQPFCPGLYLRFVLVDTRY